jgi:hypothetical protein
MSSHELYQEEESSTFQMGDKVYSLNTLFRLTQHTKAYLIPVSKLDWIFNPKNNLGNFNKKEKRTKNADYSVPVLVAEIDKQEVVIDGLHRLFKAITNGKKDILHKRVTQEMLGQALLTQAKESDSGVPSFSAWLQT